MCEYIPIGFGLFVCLAFLGWFVCFGVVLGFFCLFVFGGGGGDVWFFRKVFVTKLCSVTLLNYWLNSVTKKFTLEYSGNRFLLSPMLRRNSIFETVIDTSKNSITDDLEVIIGQKIPIYYFKR